MEEFDSIKPMAEDKPSPSPPALVSTPEPTHVPTPPPQKIGDRPHHWTVLLSTVAIVVSGLSYLESHRSRLLNEELNRPLVRALSIELIGPVLPREKFQGSKLQNAYTIIFRNSGKAFANNVHVDFRSQIADGRTGEGFAKFSDFEGATIRSETLGDLAPDDEYRFSFWSLVPKDPPTIPFGDGTLNMTSLYVKGNTAYTNPINGVQYKQSFCFLDAGTQGQFMRCSDSDQH